MPSSEYRIESTHPLAGRLLPAAGSRELVVRDRALAVSLAAKGLPRTAGGEVRVVHVPTGEIVFRKEAQPVAEPFDD